MKNLLEALGGVILGAVGCVVYIAIYGVVLVAMLVVGALIINWIF
jgi:hypothetical protein